MITESDSCSVAHLDVRANLFLYGIGFETRSTAIACTAGCSTSVCAIKMPYIDIHQFDQNLKMAYARGHRIVEDFERFLRDELPVYFQKAGTSPLHVAFDISSTNRVMMFSLLLRLARLCRPHDIIEIWYCPAAYSEPDWRFPQIEQLGPINNDFVGYNSDPSKPLCLMLGLGFEAGVSMGIISQLEPQMSFCFWGAGIDARFDKAVERANFDFRFTGFNARQISYPILDPKGSFALLESVAYGLISSYNLIVVPMGPKIFTLLTGLLGLCYPGDIAIWRAQQRRSTPPDAKPGEVVIRCTLDADRLHCSAEKLLMSLC